MIRFRSIDILPIEFRYLLIVTLLERPGREATVAELVDALEVGGVVFERRASKVVSDAMRANVGIGRVQRVSRGRYRIGHIARSSRYDIERRVRAIRQEAPLERGDRGVTRRPLAR